MALTPDTKTSLNGFTYDATNIKGEDYEEACDVLNIGFTDYASADKATRTNLVRTAYKKLSREYHPNGTRYQSLNDDAKAIADVHARNLANANDLLGDGAAPIKTDTPPSTANQTSYNSHFDDIMKAFNEEQQAYDDKRSEELKQGDELYKKYASPHNKEFNSGLKKQLTEYVYKQNDFELLEKALIRCFNVVDADKLIPVMEQYGHTPPASYLTWITKVADAMEWIQDQFDIHGGDFKSAFYNPKFTNEVMSNDEVTERRIKIDLSLFKGLKDNDLKWLKYSDIKSVGRISGVMESEKYKNAILRSYNDASCFIETFREYGEHFYNREFFDFAIKNDMPKVKKVIDRYRQLDKKIQSELPLHEFWNIVKTQAPKESYFSWLGSEDRQGIKKERTLTSFRAGLTLLEMYQQLYPVYREKLTFEDCIKNMNEIDLRKMGDEEFKNNKRDRKFVKQYGAAYGLLKKEKTKQRRDNAKQYGIYGALTLLTLAGVVVVTLGLMALPFVNVTIAVGLVAQLAATLSLSTTVMAPITSGIGALLATIGTGSLTGKLIADHRDEAHRENSPLYYDVKHIKSSFNRATGELGSDLDVKQQRQGQPSYNPHSKGKPHFFSNTQRMANFAKNMGYSVKKAFNIG